MTKLLTMKLSNKQAEVLATKIHSEIIKGNSFKISDSLRNAIQRFKDVEDDFDSKIEELEKAKDAHEKNLKKVLGASWNANIRAWNNAEQIIKAIENNAIPSIDQIEDKIILKAMFASEDDMQTFMDSVVKEYTSKQKKAV